MKLIKGEKNMSTNLSNVVATQFVEEVKHRFQEKGVLRESVRMRNAQNAKTIQFNLMGRGIATERTSIHTEIPVMGISHDPVTVSVKNYTAAELTDVFLGNQVKFDEKMELVETISGALGRRLDQVVLDAMAAYGTTKTVANDVSGIASNLSVDAIREAAKLMDEDGVPDGDRTLVVSPSGVHSLLESTEASSIDFNNVKALVRGDLNTFYGFNIKKIGNRDEGGLPLALNERTSFAYHKSAVGLALNMEPTIRIDWDEQYGAHRVTGFLSAGAGVLDSNGFVSIATVE